jgi:hypothetical protein
MRLITGFDNNYQNTNTMSNIKPKKTEQNGRDNKGRFKEGNKGKPKGATNKTTKDIKEFITNFLNDKAYEIPHIWDALEDKDKATLYLHLIRLVLPKPTDEENNSNQLNETPEPVIIVYKGDAPPFASDDSEIDTDV